MTNKFGLVGDKTFREVLFCCEYLINKGLNTTQMNTTQHKFSLVIFTLHPDNYAKPTFAVSFDPFTK